MYRTRPVNIMAEVGHGRVRGHSAHTQMWFPGLGATRRQEGQAVPVCQPQSFKDRLSPIRSLSNVFPISIVLKISGCVYMSCLFFRTWMMVYHLSEPSMYVNSPPASPVGMIPASISTVTLHSSFHLCCVILYLLLLWDSAKRESCF